MERRHRAHVRSVVMATSLQWVECNELIEQRVEVIPGCDETDTPEIEQLLKLSDSFCLSRFPIARAKKQQVVRVLELLCLVDNFSFQQGPKTQLLDYCETWL